MLHFNGHEWMVELVTEPGRLFRVQSKMLPELSRTQLWDGRPSREHPGVDAGGRNTTTASGFPTVPGPEDKEEVSSSSSGGMKEGLQWSEFDGPTLGGLGNEEDIVSHTSRSICILSMTVKPASVWNVDALMYLHVACHADTKQPGQ